MDAFDPMQVRHARDEAETRTPPTGGSSGMSSADEAEAWRTELAAALYCVRKIQRNVEDAFEIFSAHEARLKKLERFRRTVIELLWIAGGIGAGHIAWRLFGG